ncbi:MAG: hypothetical protein ABI199_00175 [Bacteroidia bacterium]
MKNTETIKINVANEFGNTLHSREAALNLFSLLSEMSSKEIEFDFSKVEYISRSFADQFYKEKEKYQNSFSVLVNISNAGEEVLSMLRIVAKTQNKSSRNYVVLPVFKYSDKAKLSDYMLSI